jgi:hypothetical protein
MLCHGFAAVFFLIIFKKRIFEKQKTYMCKAEVNTCKVEVVNIWRGWRGLGQYAEKIIKVGFS